MFRVDQSKTNVREKRLSLNSGGNVDNNMVSVSKTRHSPIGLNWNYFYGHYPNLPSVTGY